MHELGTGRHNKLMNMITVPECSLRHDKRQASQRESNLALPSNTFLWQSDVQDQELMDSFAVLSEEHLQESIRIKVEDERVLLKIHSVSNQMNL